MFRDFAHEIGDLSSFIIDGSQYTSTYLAYLSFEIIHFLDRE